MDQHFTDLGELDPDALAFPHLWPLYKLLAEGFLTLSRPSSDHSANHSKVSLAFLSRPTHASLWLTINRISSRLWTSTRTTFRLCRLRMQRCCEIISRRCQLSTSSPPAPTARHRPRTFHRRTSTFNRKLKLSKRETPPLSPCNVFFLSKKTFAGICAQSAGRMALGACRPWRWARPP